MKGYFFTLLLLLSILAFGVSTPAYAQIDKGFDAAENIATGAGLSTEEPVALIKTIINIFLGFVGLIAAAVVIYGGVMYITAAGDEQKAATAKRLILYAVVGLLLVGISALIVNIVIATFQGGPKGNPRGN